MDIHCSAEECHTMMMAASRFENHVTVRILLLFISYRTVCNRINDSLYHSILIQFKYPKVAEIESKVCREAAK
jgi:hypothetical protein